MRIKLETKTEYIPVLWTKREKALIVKLAKTEPMTVSNCIRQLVREALAARKAVSK